MINQIYTKLLKIINAIKYEINNIKLHKNCDGPVRTLGNRKYGAWTICTNNIDENSIVYSFGVGEDIGFDLDIISKFGVDVFAFDPTPRSMEWVKKQNLTKKFIFNPWGIESKNSKMLFYPPADPNHVSYSVIPKDNNQKPIEADVYTLDTIMKKLNHDHIDILKMDIEGSEYNVVNYLAENNFNIKQILIEFHDRFEHVDDNASEKSIEQLEKLGYKVFHVSRSGDEISFYKSQR